MSDFRPSGPERTVHFHGGAAIDGAPVAYIVVLAAVVATLSFIPFSVVLSSGGAFPMSQGVFGLVGWILGPWAGAVATGVGTLLGVFFAPHTAGVWPLSIYGAITASFVAGCFSTSTKRTWWPLAWLWSLASLAVYLGRAYFVARIPLSTVIWGSAVDWLAVLLLATPLRSQVVRWLRSPDLSKVAIGLFVGTSLAYGIAHGCTCAVSYYLFNWPEAVWLILIPLIPIEFVFRSIIGTVVGVGVLSGLRAIGLVKPTHATY